MVNIKASDCRYSAEEAVFERGQYGITHGGPLFNNTLVGADLLGFNILPLLRIDPRLEGFHCTIATVLVVSFLANGEEEKSREATDIEFIAEWPAVLTCTVDSGHINFLFDLVVELVPNRCKMLTVGAPGSEELDKPRLVSDQ